ncbi:MAG TPA: SDR family NAD(P)-dependent oxidoreductase [Thermoplasmata archaeon]|nr:SDR family NAD(P)-dependent oxidoreductase [Thermoplasmata archaeon]
MVDPSRRRVAVVTGATGGIGRATAMALARTGVGLALVGRSAVRVGEGVDAAAALGGSVVRGYVADLERPRDVARLADDLVRDAPGIDLLVNNAGAVFLRREETPEGMERTWALNVVAPFLLTRRLEAALRTRRGSRVVFVASEAHRYGRLDRDDPERHRGYGGWGAYSQSKLALLLLARSFADRWGPAGPAVASVHPGLVASGFARGSRGLVGRLARFGVVTFGRSPRRAGEEVAALAVRSPWEPATGGYFIRGRSHAASAAAQDAENARWLWTRLEGELGRLGLDLPDPAAAPRGAGTDREPP